MRDLDVNEEPSPNSESEPAPVDPTELLVIAREPPPTDPPPAPPPTPGDKHS